MGYPPFASSVNLTGLAFPAHKSNSDFFLPEIGDVAHL
jgi:hypothetical protein